MPAPGASVSTDRVALDRGTGGGRCWDRCLEVSVTNVTSCDFAIELALRAGAARRALTACTPALGGVSWLAAPMDRSRMST